MNKDEYISDNPMQAELTSRAICLDVDLINAYALVTFTATRELADTHGPVVIHLSLARCHGRRRPSLNSLLVSSSSSSSCSAGDVNVSVSAATLRPPTSRRAANWIFVGRLASKRRHDQIDIARGRVLPRVHTRDRTFAPLPIPPYSEHLPPRDTSTPPRKLSSPTGASRLKSGF